MSNKFFLPSKVGSYLKRLDWEYERAGKTLLREIVTSAHFVVHEEANYDGYNGGQSGHDIALYLPENVIRQIPLAKQKETSEQLLRDFNTLAHGVDHEHFSNVTLELADEDDPQFLFAAQRASNQPQINPDSLSIWTPGHLRLFISHRDRHKAAAKDLGNALKLYGISAFVAHDTIEPMTKWKYEIERGLQTMEVMLVFLTDDFHESLWTNQELGYALAKNIPIISVKFEKKDPAGFISDTQALRGDLSDPEDSALPIYKLLVKKLGQGGRLKKSIIAAFLASQSWDDARERFDLLDNVVNSLDAIETNEIIDGFSANASLHGAYYLTNQNNRLLNFMRKCTGKEFALNGKQLREKEKTLRTDEMNDDIPF